jgi:antitoxin (DNA-binding transcriptional repressor) of toxin-antitoxin stability system
MGTVHIPLAEAVRNLPDLLNRARAGEDILIEDGSSTPIRLSPAAISRRKSVSEVIAALEAREKESGKPLRMGSDFADDVEKIIDARKPRDPSKWD